MRILLIIIFTWINIGLVGCLILPCTVNYILGRWLGYWEGRTGRKNPEECEKKHECKATWKDFLLSILYAGIFWPMVITWAWKDCAQKYRTTSSLVEWIKNNNA